MPGVRHASFSWRSWWALELRPSRPTTSAWRTSCRGCTPFSVAAPPSTSAGPTNGSTATRWWLVPSLYLVTEEDGAKLVSYVERGGTGGGLFLVGIVDERDAVYLGRTGGSAPPS